MVVPGGGPVESKRLFINGLPLFAENNVLADHFGQFGEITDVYIPADLYTKEQKGIAFVTYTSSESIERALAVPQHHLYGQVVNVCRAHSKPSKDSRTDSRRLYVRNIPNSTHEEELKNIFSRHGIVTDVYLPRNSWKLSSGNNAVGFGYVTYSSTDAVQRAISAQHESGGLFLDITVAEERPQSRVNPAVREARDTRIPPVPIEAVELLPAQKQQHYQQQLSTCAMHQQQRSVQNGHCHIPPPQQLGYLAADPVYSVYGQQHQQTHHYQQHLERQLLLQQQLHAQQMAQQQHYYEQLVQSQVHHQHQLCQQSMVQMPAETSQPAVHYCDQVYNAGPAHGVDNAYHGAGVAETMQTAAQPPPVPPGLVPSSTTNGNHQDANSLSYSNDDCGIKPETNPGVNRPLVALNENHPAHRRIIEETTPQCVRKGSKADRKAKGQAAIRSFSLFDLSPGSSLLKGQQPVGPVSKNLSPAPVRQRRAKDGCDSNNNCKSKSSPAKILSRIGSRRPGLTNALQTVCSDKENRQQ